MKNTPFGYDNDIIFMQYALLEAQNASNEGEVPVGAVIVKDGLVIASGHNQVEKMHFQGAHAEMEVMRIAGQMSKDWRFDSSWLYVTLEPCLMCVGGILLSRFAGVVYGARAVQTGALDTALFSSVYNRNNFVVVSGVLAQESQELLKDFFRKKRTLKDEE